MSWESELFEGYSFPYAKRAWSVVAASAALHRGSERVEVDILGAGAPLVVYAQVEDLDSWERLELTLSIEGQAGTPGCPWLQIICEETRLELVTDLAGADLSAVEVSLPIGDVRGAVLVRSLGVSGDGAASGLVIADSAGVILQFDPPGEPFGSGLRTQWDKQYFVDRGIERSLSCVDFPASGEPCLYLNSGVRDFSHLLKSKATSGAVAATRQLLLDQLECDTWFALGRRAADQMYRMDADTGDAIVESEDLSEMWQGVALRKVAKAIGLGSDEDARAAAAARLLQADRHEDMRCALAASVGKGRGVAARVERLADELGKGRRSGS